MPSSCSSRTRCAVPGSTLRWIQTKARLRFCSCASTLVPLGRRRARGRARAPARCAGASTTSCGTAYRLSASTETASGRAGAVEDRAAPRVDVDRALALARALLLEELAAQHLQVHQPDADHERPQRDREREQHQPQPRAALARRAAFREARGRPERQSVTCLRAVPPPRRRRGPRGARRSCRRPSASRPRPPPSARAPGPGARARGSRSARRGAGSRARPSRAAACGSPRSGARFSRSSSSPACRSRRICEARPGVEHRARPRARSRAAISSSRSRPRARVDLAHDLRVVDRLAERTTLVSLTRPPRARARAAARCASAGCSRVSRSLGRSGFLVRIRKPRASSARNACLTSRSSRRVEGDHRQPPRRPQAAARCARRAGSSPSSSRLTRMRSAWNVRVAGSKPGRRRVGSGAAHDRGELAGGLRSAPSRAPRTIARAMRREQRLLAELVDQRRRARSSRIRFTSIGRGLAARVRSMRMSSGPSASEAEAALRRRRAAATRRRGRAGSRRQRVAREPLRDLAVVGVLEPHAVAERARGARARARAPRCRGRRRRRRPSGADAREDGLAWPPRPTVPSTYSPPGLTASSSSVSASRTGTWPASDPDTPRAACRRRR